jgi:hypothetical protein
LFIKVFLFACILSEKKVTMQRGVWGVAPPPFPIIMLFAKQVVMVTDIIALLLEQKADVHAEHD